MKNIPLLLNTLKGYNIGLFSAVNFPQYQMLPFYFFITDKNTIKYTHKPFKKPKSVCRYQSSERVPFSPSLGRRGGLMVSELD